LLLETERNLDLGSFDAAQDSVDEYLRSVGDALPIYNETGLVPPLYLAAWALGSALRKLGLPPGAIHSLQEIATLKPVTIGSEIKVSGMLEKPRQRAGLQFLTFVCTIESGGAAVLTSKSTVLLASRPSASPEEASPGGVPTEQAGRKTNKPTESNLPVISRDVTQERLNAYAKASGDDNPLHLDEEFAAKTQFGGIIAHGMLTLAFISEMMAAAHGRDWLESGTLRVRFKGAAYLGDQLETRGNLAKEQGSSRTYSVGVWNSASGQELVSGTAAFKRTK
jgi:acyl dehydratase